MRGGVPNCHICENRIAPSETFVQLAKVTFTGRTPFPAIVAFYGIFFWGKKTKFATKKTH